MKSIWKFLNMKETDPAKILIIVGPYNSGKTTLRKLIELHNGKPKWDYRGRLCRMRSVPLSEMPPATSSILSYVYEQNSGLEEEFKYIPLVMNKEISFTAMRSHETRTFCGNQAIIETCKIKITDFFNRKDIIVIKTSELKIRQPNFTILSEHFKKWMNEMDRYVELKPKVLQLMMIKKYRNIPLPKDLVRLLIFKLLSKPFKNINNKEFKVTMIGI
jgi:hypothetical protein